MGPTGFAYGLDMTDEMLALADENKRKSGLDNVDIQGRRAASNAQNAHKSLVAGIITDHNSCEKTKKVSPLPPYRGAFAS